MSKTVLGGLIGGGVGLLAGAGVALLAALPGLLLGAVTVGSMLAGTAVGAGTGFLLAHRLPEMLPPYRAEHNHLRQIAKQISKNLRRLTGTEIARHRLEEVLAKDANLRHQATVLKKTIVEEVHRSLNWLDRLQGGLELLRGYLRSLGSLPLNSIEWTLRAYRVKLDREVRQLGEQLEQVREPNLSQELQTAYRMKWVERSHFMRLQKAIQQIEVELTKIRTSLEAILIQTTHAVHVELPQAIGSPAGTEEALLALHQELKAFEDALPEMLAGQLPIATTESPPQHLETR